MNYTNSASAYNIKKNQNMGFLAFFSLKALILSVLSICLILAHAPNTSAQTSEKKIGHKGFINKGQILSTLAKGEIVDGYIINGDDLIDIINETNHDIKIKTSIVIGGIRFTKLTREPLRKESLPQDWDEKIKDYLIKEKAKYKGHLDIIHVGNRIEIIDCEVKSDIKEYYSIDARMALFHKKCSFRGTTFVGEADFCGSVFSEEGDFSNAIFQKGINIQSAFFRKYARFNHSYFVEQASFRLTIFIKGAEFFPATFKDRADFFGTKFFASASFFVATFMKDADFQQSTFASNAEFSLAKFHDKASFSNAWVNDNADFIQTVFMEEADFSDSHFSKDVAFRSATFSKLAYFKGLWVGNTIDLRLCNLMGYGDFRSAHITKFNFNCSSSPTTISGRIDLRNTFISEAHFEDIIFEEDVDFSDVVFLSPYNKYQNRNPNVTIFRFVTFEADALFIRTKFLGDIAFESLKFNRDANFSGAIFKGRKINCEHKICLSYLSFKNLILEWDQLPDLGCWISETENRLNSFSDIESKGEAFKGIKEGLKKGRKGGIGDLEPMSQVLKTLELNFRNKGSLKDANEAFFHMKMSELSEARRKIDFLVRIPKEFEYIFWGISCGYGRKIGRIICWSVFFNILFTTIYVSKGGLRKSSRLHNKLDHAFGVRIFNSHRQYIAAHINPVLRNRHFRDFLNAFFFSTAILWKVGYKDTTISGLRTIVFIEWLLGYYLIIMFLLTLSNTWPFLHGILKGLL